MTDNIEDVTVVDGGTTYESQESAIIAKEEADKAKLWAQESERQANLASGSADTAAQARDEAVNVVNGFTQRVTEATNTFNSNATAKTNDFNNNATAKTTAFNDNYTEKKALIDAQVAIAESSATNANNYKNKAREWAVSQNIVDNEDYSAKYWAGKAEEWAESVGNPANKDLSNLSVQGQNIANWSTNVTNCITEIPQDIKLELNNGTLTLKAGSKVYVPNGSGVFDEIVIANDVIIPSWANLAQGMLSIKPLTSEIWVSLMNQQYSGSTIPTGSQYGLWYDTNSNKVKTTSNTGSTWTDGYSLPFALITSNESSWTSIDQVFNGFGYIGSTVFALPGVKGLIPNGRNEDGTLKNIEFTIDSVKTVTRTWVDGGGQVWGYIKNPPAGFSETWYWNRYVESDEEPSSNEYSVWYKPSENITYINNGAQSSTPNWEKVNYINFGKAGGKNSQEIKIFTPKTPFRTLDYNDSSTISGWSMPSSKYVDLTFGASGASYIAPANGYFYIAANGNSDYSNWIEMINNSASSFARGVYGPLGWQYKNAIEAKRGDIVNIIYENINTPAIFRFIYTEGENV